MTKQQHETVVAFSVIRNLRLPQLETLKLHFARFGRVEKPFELVRQAFEVVLRRCALAQNFMLVGHGCWGILPSLEFG